MKYRKYNKYTRQLNRKSERLVKLADKIIADGGKPHPALAEYAKKQKQAEIDAFTTYPDRDHPWIQALLAKGMKIKCRQDL